MSGKPGTASVDFHFFDPDPIAAGENRSTDFYQDHLNSAIRIQRKVHHRLIKRRQRNEEADPYQPQLKRSRCEDKVASNLHQFHISDEWSRPELIDSEKWFFLKKPLSSFEEIENSLSDELEEETTEIEGPVIVVKDSFKDLLNPSNLVKPTALVGVNKLKSCTDLVLWRPPTLLPTTESNEEAAGEDDIKDVEFSHSDLENSSTALLSVKLPPEQDSMDCD